MFRSRLVNRLFLMVLLGGMWAAGCGRQPLAPDPDLIEIGPVTPVIFDTDLAHEDMIAALFLLAHPNIDVRAITVAGTGEVHCSQGVGHAASLVAVSGRDDIPVACGRQVPLAGFHVFPAGWRQQANEAYGVDLPAGGQPLAISAPELIIDLLRAADEPLTIVAVGPLTNVAEVLRGAPELGDRVAAVYVMGGAISARGNVGNSGVGIQNDHAEWNFYIDPHAANIVLESGVPVVMVPLDATARVPVTYTFYDALREHRETPAAKLVYDILGANLNFIDSGGFHFWDTLTAAVAADGRLAEVEEMGVRVVEAEGRMSGRTLVEDGAPLIRVATDAERRRFEQTLLTVLNWDQ